MRMQSDGKGPRGHIGLAPDVPDGRRIGSPIRPGRGFELKQTDVTCHVVVRPGVELALTDGRVEEPIPGDPVSPSRFVYRRYDPVLRMCVSTLEAVDSEYPSQKSTKQRSPLHE